MLGPLQAEFGALTAAGVRIAGNVKEGLNLGRGLPLGHKDYDPRIFSKTKEIIGQQVTYIGHLVAMYHWYREIRIRSVSTNPERLALYQAGQRIIVLNIRERIAQIERFINGLETSIRILSQQPLPPRSTIAEQQALLKHWPHLKAHLEHYEEHFWEIPHLLSNALQESASLHTHYTQIIRNLPQASVNVGQSWLESIVHRCENYFKNELKF